MKFLVIFIAVMMDRVTNLHQFLHRDAWFRAWREAVQGVASAPSGQLLVVVGLPVAGVWLLSWLVQGHLFGLPELLFSVCVLFYALGRGKVDHKIADYLAEWLRGDDQAAWYTMSHWLPNDSESMPENARDLHAAVRAAYIGRIFYGLFVPLFWYFLLGPFAAALVVGMSLCAQREEGDALRDLACRLRSVIGWLPARLFAMSCALVGGYRGAARVIAEDFLAFEKPSVDTVERAALGALEEPAGESVSESFRESASNEFQSLRELFDRCLMVLLVLVALATIFGWN